jgi:hypothetical protein
MSVALLAMIAPRPSCGNRFQEAWVMNCEHTFDDGTTYDLRALTRTAGRPDYIGKDKRGDMYFMNVCNNVQEIPKECKALMKGVKSPAYHVRNDSFCHWLGVEGSHQWDFIEPQSPNVGVQLTYTHGEICDKGVNRKVKMQFFCDSFGRLGSVQDYYVSLEEPCTYVVTFPTVAGCPKQPTMSSGWVFVLCFVLFVGAYVGTGIALNVHKRHMPVSVDAIPHIDLWRQVPDLVKDGVAFSWDWVLVKAGARQATGGGGSFEWSGL